MNHSLGPLLRGGKYKVIDDEPFGCHVTVPIAAEGPDGAIRHLIAVDIQLEPDPEKRFSWPLYVVWQRARLRVPVTLIVVAPDSEVARWCAEPIELDCVGSIYRPLVVGPDSMPPITDIGEARAFPEMAVLSAIAHSRTASAEHVALAAVLGCNELEDNHPMFYTELVMSLLSEATKKALKARLDQHDLPPHSYLARLRFVNELVQRLQERFDQGCREAFEKGVRQGTHDKCAQVLYMWIRQRFGAVPADIAARIETADTDQLDCWLDRIVDAPTLDAVFSDPSATD